MEIDQIELSNMASHHIKEIRLEALKKAKEIVMERKEGTLIARAIIKTAMNDEDEEIRKEAKLMI